MAGGFRPFFSGHHLDVRQPGASSGCFRSDGKPGPPDSWREGLQGQQPEGSPLRFHG